MAASSCARARLLLVVHVSSLNDEAPENFCLTLDFASGSKTLSEMVPPKDGVFCDWPRKLRSWRRTLTRRDELSRFDGAFALELVFFSACWVRRV